MIYQAGGRRCYFTLRLAARGLFISLNVNKAYRTFFFVVVLIFAFV